MTNCGKFALALLAATAVATAAADARQLKWARSGDSLTLDPHAQNEGPTHGLNHHLYEPLIHRDTQGKEVAALAVSWKVTDDAKVWEFKLRPNVKFHNGNGFNADDVVFSLERARQPTSDMKGLLTSVDTITKVDDMTVHIKTKGPNPLLPNNLTDLFIMDKEWSEANNVQKPQDFKNKEENYAVRNANGTGPFQLVSREPDVRTVMKRNDSYWGIGQVPLQITELVYIPIKADATRLADRTIFFGMDVASADLKGDNVQGKNPFADKKVRQAMNMAVNRQAIQRVAMRGQSVPTGVIMPPFVHGWTKELDAVPSGDTNAAKKLLADAGYPNGFSVTLHCPNDRYVNDEAICQAAVGMWGQIGVKVNMVSQSKSIHFPLIQKNPPETEFYLLGWGVPTFDSEYIFSFLYHTRNEKFGSWNALRYSSAEADRMIEQLSSETDKAKRDATIAKLWALFKDETFYLPVHHQTLAYAMKTGFDIPVDVSNQPKLKYVSFKTN